MEFFIQQDLEVAHTTYTHTPLARTHHRATCKLTARKAEKMGVSRVFREEKKKTTKILVKIEQSLVPSIITLKRMFLLL